MECQASRCPQICSHFVLGFLSVVALVTSSPVNLNNSIFVQTTSLKGGEMVYHAADKEWFQNESCTSSMRRKILLRLLLMLSWISLVCI